MFWDNYERLCTQKGTSPSAVCRKIGLSNATATHWRQGALPKADAIIAISKELNCSVDALLGVSKEPSIVILDDDVYQIPVFESVSAGMGVYADSRIVGYTSVTVKKSDIDKIIAAKVIGDSMYPYINDGDTVIIKKDCEVDNGDIAVILLDDEAVVKKVQFGQDSITLISFNPMYKDRIIKESDCDNVRIIGKVIGSYKTW